MPAFVTFGRILFAVLFIYTGATKLFAVQQTADFIASKMPIPALLAPYTSQLETLTGIRRAGAGMVLTYWATEAAGWLTQSAINRSVSPGFRTMLKNPTVVTNHIHASDGYVLKEA